MRGMIPIVNKDGDQVARLTWFGTPWSGRGHWWYANSKAKKTIEAARVMNKDLEKVPFCDMYTETGQTFGWKGFSGWFQALSSSLPPFGLDMDRDKIEWPVSDESEPTG